MIEMSIPKVKSSYLVNVYEINKFFINSIKYIPQGNVANATAFCTRAHPADSQDKCHLTSKY